MNIAILKSSESFLSAIKKDLAAAKKRVYIQILCIEGDQTGKTFCNELLACNVKAKIIVDSIVKVMINDKFIYHPNNYNDPQLRQEIKATIDLYSELRHNGIQVQLGKPLGKYYSNFLSRNHTKCIIIDNIVYTGGRNLCDHNFTWNDLMLRFENSDIADFMETDFEKSWTNTKERKVKTIKEKDNSYSFIILNGVENESSYDYIRKLLENAKKSILIHSPYISHPFFSTLRDAKARNIKIDLISPKENNHKLLNRFTRWECKRIGINLYHLAEMTHLKAILIDDETLIVGTSNFDYLSYRHLQELIVIIKDPEFIKEFKSTVLIKDISKAILYTKRTPRVTGPICKFFLLESINLYSSYSKLLSY